MALELDISQLVKSVNVVPEKVQRGVVAAMEYQRPEAETWLRNNATWTDRTGNARNGLFATTKHEGNRHVMVLAHSVPYGIWLEVRFAGRYAVIEPGVRAQGAELMNTLRGMLESF